MREVKLLVAVDSAVSWRPTNSCTRISDPSPRWRRRWHFCYYNPFGHVSQINSQNHCDGLFFPSCFLVAFFSFFDCLFETMTCHRDQISEEEKWGEKEKRNKKRKKKVFHCHFLDSHKTRKTKQKTNHSLDVKQKIARIFLGGAGGASTVRAAAALRFLSRVSQTTTSSRSLNSIPLKARRMVLPLRL